MSTNGATTTSPAGSSNNSSALKPSENDTGYDSSKYYKKPAAGSRPSSPVAPPPPPPALIAPMPVSTKRLSASETSKLLMESDSDSDTLVIDMGAPSRAPKPVAAEAPPKVKEEDKVKEEPKESSKPSPEVAAAGSAQKPAKKSDDSKPAGTKIVKYDGSKSSEKANSNCDTFDFVEDAMAAMFAGLEDESPKKKKKPESTAPATTPKTQKKVDTSSADKKTPKVKEEPKESEAAAASSTQKSAKKADQHSKTELSKKKASSDAKAAPDKKRVSGPSKQIKKEASDDVPKPPVKRKASDEGCSSSSSSKRKASDQQIVTPDKSSSDKLPYSGKKRGPKPKKQEAPSRRNSKEGVASTSKTAASKGRTKKEKELLASQTEQERLLEKHKGPFVRVDGNPDSPRFSNVVNCPSDALTPEEAAKRGAPDFDSRVRVTGFGPATTSTLSSRYDPRTVDESWTCVFCQKGSHHARMGDLFGPYHVSCDVLKASASPASPNYTRSPVKNSSQDLAIEFILGGDRSKRSKRARHKSAEKAASNESRAEVWFHEDCVCWCPDVKVVGNVVLGLDEAVAATQRAPCSKCHLRGSTLGCVAKGCRETAHFNCARLQKWTLDDDLFQARCAQHSQK